MLKRVDVAVFEAIEGADRRHVQVAARTTYDLRVDGVGYSTIGGFVDDIIDQLDDFKQQIIDGEITVPTDPTNSVTSVELRRISSNERVGPAESRSRSRPGRAPWLRPSS